MGSSNSGAETQQQQEERVRQSLEALLQLLDAYPNCSSNSAAPCSRCPYWRLFTSTADVVCDPSQPPPAALVPPLLALAAKLLQNQHSVQASATVRRLFDILVVQPVTARLASADPAVAAAARAESLQAAVAVSRSGLLPALMAAWFWVYAALHRAIGALPDSLQDPQVWEELVLCNAWVHGLHRIWPSSILTAAGTGELAAQALSVADKYLGLVQQVCSLNHQLPASLPHVTAGVVRTAALLLIDCSQQLQPRSLAKLPAVVRTLWSESTTVMTVAVVAVSIHTSQLLQHLQQQLQQGTDTQHQHQQHQQQPQPVAHAGQPGSPSSSSSSSPSSSSSRSSSSSSSSSAGPARFAEGVLLRRADGLQSQQLEQLPGHPAVAAAWQQHCSSFWESCRMPPELLLGAGSAIADVRADMQAMRVASGTSSGTSSSSSNGESQPQLISLAQCISTIAAVATVTQRAVAQQYMVASGRNFYQCLELLLLTAAVAGVRLSGAAALPLVEASLGAVAEIDPAVTATGWPTVGTLSLLLQQLLCLLRDQGGPAAAAGAAGNAKSSSSSGGDGGGSSQGDDTVSRSSDGTAGGRDAAAAPSGVEQTVHTCLCVLHTALESACKLPDSWSPARLEQAAFAVQVAEAAVRALAPYEQLQSQRLTQFHGKDCPSLLLFKVARAVLLPAQASLTQQPCDVEAAVPVQQLLQAVLSALATANTMGPNENMLTWLQLHVDTVRLLYEATAQQAQLGAGHHPAGAWELSTAFMVLSMNVCALGEHIFDCLFGGILESNLAWGVSCWARLLAALREDTVTPEEAASQTVLIEECRQALLQLHALLIDLFKVLAGCNAALTGSSSGSSGIGISGIASLLLSDLSQQTEALIMAVRRTAACLLTETLPRLVRIDASLKALLEMVDEVGKGKKSWQGPVPNLLLPCLDPEDGTLGSLFVMLCRDLSGVGERLAGRMTSSYICNNSNCRNAATVSAGFQLVRGRACVCGGCVAGGQPAGPDTVAAARYCSVACQREHCVHRDVCPGRCVSKAAAGQSADLDGVD